MVINHKTIAFIGPGVMAEAMIYGLIQHQVAGADEIVAAGPRRERLDQLQAEYHIATVPDNREAVGNSDVVVLSVKPQRLDRVLGGLSGVIQPQALVISIVAGAPIEKIARGL